MGKYNFRLYSITHASFKPYFKRLMRQLSERAIKVEYKQKSDNYYQNNGLSCPQRMPKYGKYIMTYGKHII